MSEKIQEHFGEIPLDQYREFHRLMPIACVDIILVKGNSFLLVKRKNAPAREEWWFPGGRIIRNECLVDAVIRKTSEETGLEITDCAMLGVDETMFPDGPFGGTTHTINVVFKANVDSDQVVLDSQSDEYQWFEQIDDNWDPYVEKFLSKAGFSC